MYIRFKDRKNKAAYNTRHSIAGAVSRSRHTQGTEYTVTTVCLVSSARDPLTRRPRQKVVRVLASISERPDTWNSRDFWEQIRARLSEMESAGTITAAESQGFTDRIAEWFPCPTDAAIKAEGAAVDAAMAKLMPGAR